MNDFVKLADDLEDMVDVYGIRAVLEQLASVCEEKYDHIATNYSDSDKLAQQWRQVGSNLTDLTQAMWDDLPT